MERFFEKISYEEFKKDIKEDEKLYAEYVLPIRKTKSSAGYDFIAMEDFSIRVGETKKIATGYKAKFNEDEMLLILVRSSMGVKYNIRLTNQVGVIDSDYYNNIDNEGHLYVVLKNEGDKEFFIKKGDGYAQGIFVKYLTCGEEVTSIRTSGFGSTNRKEEE